MAYTFKPYTESDAVKQAQQALQNHQATKPGQYQSQWQGQMNDLLGQIQNRDKFQYNIDEDALYQQAAQRYVQQGQQAMMDTMGQAAAMTGGYGNSYAQTAGQQTYQNYLLGLNDMIPQFHQMALDQYQMEGNDLLNRYGLLAQQEESDYGRYMDMLNQYYSELDRLQGAYDSERDYDYGRFADDRDFDYNRYMAELNYQYQLDRDKIADQQWQAQFDEAKRQWEAAQAAKTSSGGGGGGGSYSGNQGYDAATVRKAQQFVGTKVDGMWGKNSTAAAKAKGYGSLSEVISAMGGGTEVSETAPSGFTGTTYAEATAYIKANGGSGTPMTQSEWTRRKNSYDKYGTGGVEVKNYSSYAQYLKDYVEYATK